MGKGRGGEGREDERGGRGGEGRGEGRGREERGGEGRGEETKECRRKEWQGVQESRGKGVQQEVE